MNSKTSAFWGVERGVKENLLKLTVILAMIVGADSTVLLSDG